MAEMHKGYAAALFELASNEEMSKEIKELVDILKSHDGYIELLSTPLLSKHERLSLIAEVLGDRFSDTLTAFVTLMCEKGVIKELPECEEEYQKIYKESLKASVAYVYSAVMLNDNEKLKLKEKFEKVSGRNVSFVYCIDESLVGGIRVEMDGKIFDGSVKSRLDNIKKVICQ